MDWNSAVEIISEGAVTAGVQQGETPGYATWAVADNKKIAQMHTRRIGTVVLKGRCDGSDAFETARRKAEDAFYGYLDYKKTRAGII